MRNQKIFICLFLGLLGSFSASAQNEIPGYTISSATDQTTAQTAYGKVSGYIEKGIYTYKGIPYAQAGRYEEPRAPKSWSGVRSSRSYGYVAPHPARTGWSDDMSAFVFRWNDGFMGEDCQRLNIWTPGIGDGKKRPVMVWLHGGGFAEGSGQEHPGYDGRNLAEKGDVVVITLNHRLNALGFLDLSAFGEKYKHSGNLGMLDIVAALKWVHENIANFGGDPGNVTIFGQSGGGGKVCTLMSMPSAKGLFHKAIIQSGTINEMMTQEWARKVGQKTVELLGLDASSVDKIKTLPYEQVEAANMKAISICLEEAHKQGLHPFIFGQAPVVDGDVLPANPIDKASQELSSDIPVMVGTTVNEFAGFNHDPKLKTMTWDEAKSALTKTYGKNTDKFISLFRQAYPNAKAGDALLLDVIFRPYTVEGMDARVRTAKAPVYNYIFGYQSPVFNGGFHAAHCFEIPFAFNNVRLSASMTGAQPDALKLGDAMSQAWINFARTGNPNNNLLPKWDPYTLKSGAVMYFDAPSSKVLYKHDHKLMEFINKMNRFPGL